MENVNSLPTLYKRDSKGKIRMWTMQWGHNRTDDAGTRTISGLVDGQKVTSGWNKSIAKNHGKVNYKSAMQQAEAEARAEWTKKSDKEYFDNIDDIDEYALFKPMLAQDFTKKPTNEGISQPKLDGIRCVTDNKGMHTRGGKPINSCPHIMESLQSLINANPDIVLDGELYNHELKADFQKIVSLVRKLKCRPNELAESAQLVEYHVYDMYDKKHPDMSFMERHEWLQKNVSGNKIVLVPTTEVWTKQEIDDLYGLYIEQGYEGQMIRKNEPYECKRSKYLLKRKEFISEEFPVVRIEEGKGNWAGHAKRFVLQLPDGRTFGSGVRGRQAELKKLWDTQNKPDWATCRYFEKTNDGVPRFPVVVDYGKGKRTD